MWAPDRDITLRFSDITSNLYTGILRRPGNLRLNILRTGNFQAAAAMTLLVDRNSVDQPYVGTRTTPGVGHGQDRVYVGLNDFAAPGVGQTATIDFNLDAAAPPQPPLPSGFVSARIERRTTSGQDRPPIRPAVHPDGTVYGAFYRWTSFVGGVATVDVVVVRDDDGAGGANIFSDLTDPSDGVAGRRVVTGRSVPFINSSQPSFGQERMVASTSRSRSIRATARMSTSRGPIGSAPRTTHCTSAARSIVASPGPCRSARRSRTRSSAAGRDPPPPGGAPARSSRREAADREADPAPAARDRAAAHPASRVRRHPQNHERHEPRARDQRVWGRRLPLSAADRDRGEPALGHAPRALRRRLRHLRRQSAGECTGQRAGDAVHPLHR